MSDENYDEWWKKSEKRQTREARITSTKPSFNLSKPWVTITETLESPYLRIPSKTYPATTILSYLLLHLNDAILWSFPSHYHCCNSLVFRFLFHHTATVMLSSLFLLLLLLHHHQHGFVFVLLSPPLRNGYVVFSSPLYVVLSSSPHTASAVFSSLPYNRHHHNVIVVLSPPTHCQGYAVFSSRSLQAQFLSSPFLSSHTAPTLLSSLLHHPATIMFFPSFTTIIVLKLSFLLHHTGMIKISFLLLNHLHLHFTTTTTKMLLSTVPGRQTATIMLSSLLILHHHQHNFAVALHHSTTPPKLCCLHFSTIIITTLWVSSFQLPYTSMVMLSSLLHHRHRPHNFLVVLSPHQEGNVVFPLLHRCHHNCIVVLSCPPLYLSYIIFPPPPPPPQLYCRLSLFTAPPRLSCLASSTTPFRLCCLIFSTQITPKLPLGRC